MKKLILVFALICPLLLNAQTKNELENIKKSLDMLFEHIEKNNIELLQPYLSEDVKVSGHEGNLALLILKSIPLQVAAPSDYEITNIKLVDDLWHLNVVATVSNDSADYSFMLDKEFKFLDINMFDVQVMGESNDKKTKLEEPLVVPFILEDNIIYFKAFIKGVKDTLNLVFDTGATVFALDITFASKNNIKPLSYNQGTGAAGSTSYQMANVEALQVGNFELSNPTAVLVDLSHFDDEPRIHGIIGRDLLNKYVGKIDYDRGELVFYNDIAKIQTLYENKLAFDFENDIPIPQTTIRIKLKSGQEFSGKVMMDTGANPNFLLNSNITRDNNLLEAFDPKFVTSYKSLTGEDEEEYISTIDTLSFMQENYADVPILVPLSKGGVNAFPNLLGILGNGILNRYNWIFDYSNLTAYYQPNSLKNNAFEYPLTDFEINREDNKMFFKNVQADSNLGKKNIENGMEIKSINGYGMEDFIKIKALMKKEFIKLKIKYFDSNGKVKKITIKTERKI